MEDNRFWFNLWLLGATSIIVFFSLSAWFYHLSWADYNLVMQTCMDHGGQYLKDSCIK